VNINLVQCSSSSSSADDDVIDAVLSGVYLCLFVRFREELKIITNTIVQRNKERESELKYACLVPTNIANNINV